MSVDDRRERGDPSAPGGGARHTRRRWRDDAAARRYAAGGVAGGGADPSSSSSVAWSRSYYRASRLPPYFAEAEEAMRQRAMLSASAAPNSTASGTGGGSLLSRRMRGASSMLGLDMLEEASVSAGADGPAESERGEADAAAGSRKMGRRQSSLSRFLSAAGSSFTGGAPPLPSNVGGQDAEFNPPSLLGSPSRAALAAGSNYTNYLSAQQTPGGVGAVPPLALAGAGAGEDGEGLGGTAASAGKTASAATISAAAAAGGGFLPPSSILHPLGDPGGGAGGLGTGSGGTTAVPPTWRLKERMKTVGVGMILALNIGTDPPDVRKPNPCATLQCWIDPTAMSRAKARERIGERLEGQYARWQQRAKLKYRRALDPTAEDVQTLCVTMRRQARGERLLLHYNGHGVPRPTSDGEFYVFDKNHTHFIPLNTLDFRKWIGRPSIVVLDCGGAGVLLPYLAGMMDAPPPVDGLIGGQPPTPAQRPPTFAPVEGESDADYAARSVRDTIVLCPTSPGELLPMNPELPADLFTSCLTTPIPVALRWFVHRNPLSCGANLDLEAVDAVPGKVNDRKTPLGELNWIFTAVTDTIAWNVLPSPLFQRLFRQDLIVASMFRNFLLADRILRSLNCNPMSFPSLPPTADHPLWEAWDLAVETCLHRLLKDGLLGNETVPLRRPGSSDDMAEAAVARNAADGAKGQPKAQQPQPPPHQPQQQQQQQATAPGAGRGPAQPPTRTAPSAATVTAPFFSEQLTAFEIWLEFAATRVVDGFAAASASNCCLEGGGESIDPAAATVAPLESPEQLPVVLQVLLSQAHRVRALVLLRRFLDLGPGAVNLALSVGIFPYVLKLLQSSIDEYKHVLVGIWAEILHFDPSCQVDLVKDGALPHFIRHLRWGLTTGSIAATGSGAKASPPGGSAGDNGGTGMTGEDAAEQRTMAAVILSAICRGYPLGQAECLKKGLHTVLASLLSTVEFERGTDGETRGEQKATEDTAEARAAAAAAAEQREEQRAFAEERVPPLFRLWLCLCLGNLIRENVAAQAAVLEAGAHRRLLSRLDDACPDVRAAACCALGYLLGSTPLPEPPDLDEEEDEESIDLPPGQSVPAPLQQPLLHRQHQPQLQLQMQQQQQLQQQQLRGMPFAQQQGLPPGGVAAQLPHHLPAGRPQQPGMVPGLAGPGGGAPTLVPAQMGAGGAMVMQPLPHPVAPGATSVVLPGAGQQSARLMPQHLQQQPHPSMQQQQQPHPSQPLLQPRGAQVPGQAQQQAQMMQYGPIGAQGIVPAAINGVPAAMLQQAHPQQQPPLPPGGAAVLPPFQLQHQQQPLHQNPPRLHPAQHQQPQLHAPHPSLQMQRMQPGQPRQHQMPALNHQQRAQTHPQHHPGYPAAAAPAPPLGPTPASLRERHRRRVDVDLTVADRLASAVAGDASPTVRYEATLSLAGVVRKHLPAFAAAAAEAAAKERQGTTLSPSSAHAAGNGAAEAEGGGGGAEESKVSSDAAEDDEGGEGAKTPSFAGVWSALHAMQRSDPHPIISDATNQVVSAVHEYVLLRRMDGSGGGGDAENTDSFEGTLKHCRTSSMLTAGAAGEGAMLIPPPISLGRSTSVGAVSPPAGLRRNQSDHAALGHGTGLGRDAASGGVSAVAALISPRTKKKTRPANLDVIGESGGFYELPESKFYEWKREEFAARSGGGGGRWSDDNFGQPPPSLDPLSVEGATWSYRERRNAEVHAWSDALAEEYAALAYKPPRGRSSSSIEGLFDDLQDEAETRESAKLEAELTSKKTSLHLHQRAMLLNEGKKGSYMMQFHPYEPALIVCDGASSISVWDTNDSKLSVSFGNSNPKGSRMTSVSWMNEMTTSLLLAGSDDGTVRVWDGLLDGFGRMSRDPPKLSTAFSAAPDLVAGQRGSGLVTEWQQFGGRLIAGGSSDMIRCWDLKAERCANELKTNVGACVTTLTTAWDFDMFGCGGIGGGGVQGSSSARGYSGIGPDIIVAGFGDGGLKVFDIRAKTSPVGGTPNVGIGNGSGSEGTRVRRLRRNKLMQYAEHESWIVNTAFTTFGGRNEIVSGCVAGDIKFWDLRMQESLRTLDVQRSPMTALALHPGMPLLSTGSHAQFIKILALDGDTLQVIRFHEKIAGQRIGPVSCLCFHPHKPLLAAGATDEIISLYSPDAK